MVLRLALMVALLVGSVSQAHAFFENYQERLQAIKTVGIISAVGDRFTFSKTGLVAADRGQRIIAVTVWGLDDAIVQQVTSLLNSRFQVTPVTYARADFFAMKRSPLDLLQGDPLEKLVKAVSPQGLDAYIVITKAAVSLGAGGRNVQGLGVVTYQTVTDSYTAIYALYEIRIFEGKTFKVIDQMAAAPVDATTAVRLAGPTALFNGAVPTTIGEDIEPLHRGIVELITRSLPATLDTMHLR